MRIKRPTSFLFMRKDFHQDDGHFSDVDQKRSGILLMIANHKENGTDTQFSVPRVHRPEEGSKAKVGGKLSIHFCADPGTIETVFRAIISVNQLSIYGAVAGMCEECDSCHDRTRRPVLERQSNSLFVPSVIGPGSEKKVVFYQ